jgi:hypothetical protein
MPSKAEALAVFSELQRAKAREIISRIQQGETIPLPELEAFLSDSGKTLQQQVRTAEAPAKPTDVDFF